MLFLGNISMHIRGRGVTLCRLYHGVVRLETTFDLCVLHVQAPIQAIVTHPEHDILYLEDIMFGGFSKSELQVLVDTFITNAPPAGYMVCEM
jgi:hypothetical protein